MTVESEVTHLPDADAFPDRAADSTGGIAGLSPAHRPHVDTRDGWREVDDLNDFKQPDRTGRALVEYDGPVIAHVWVREEPVPPLPTERDTVIRPDWRDPRGMPSKILLWHDYWFEVGGPRQWTDAEVRSLITGFKVLAEPKFAADGQQLTMAVADHHREMRESQRAWQTVGEAAERSETIAKIVRYLEDRGWWYGAAGVKRAFGDES